MKLLILDEKDGVAEYAAKYVVKRINDFNPNENKYFVLCLPTGGTPLGMYKKLVEYYKKGMVSFEFVISFNLDEYVGIPRDHEQSYHSFMYDNFFSHININPKNVNILDGNADDLQRECERYEEKIAEAGGIELLICGVGVDGHIAFNEPASSLASLTRIKTLCQDTIEANARFFEDDITKVPTQALTVGVKTIMDSREVMVLITGQNKALALCKAIEEGISHMWTISALQLHRNTIFIVDENSTMELKNKTVKYFKGLMSEHMKLID
uniref:Glucosamine-6-phosphate isomerase n=1 Tax=Rhabditophanes sp. KR3021 TaxID=114890 RepID=A0AC35THA5_9BILA